MPFGDDSFDYAGGALFVFSHSNGASETGQEETIALEVILPTTTQQNPYDSVLDILNYACHKEPLPARAGFSVITYFANIVTALTPGAP